MRWLTRRQGLGVLPISVGYGLQKNYWGENKMSKGELTGIIIGVVCVIVHTCNVIDPS